MTILSRGDERGSRNFVVPIGWSSPSGIGIEKVNFGDKSIDVENVKF
jgi:hypothetical protein